DLPRRIEAGEVRHPLRSRARYESIRCRWRRDEIDELLHRAPKGIGAVNRVGEAFRSEGEGASPAQRHGSPADRLGVGQAVPLISELAAIQLHALRAIILVILHLQIAIKDPLRS